MGVQSKLPKMKYNRTASDIGAIPNMGDDRLDGDLFDNTPAATVGGVGPLLEGLRGAWPMSENVEDQRFDGPYHGVDRRINRDFMDWLSERPVSSYNPVLDNLTPNSPEYLGEYIGAYNDRVQDYMEMQRKLGAAKAPGRLKTPAGGIPGDRKPAPVKPRDKPKHGQKKKMTPPKPRAKPVVPERYGRGGDDTMLHVSNQELAALNEMVPGGLSTNPETGYAEAFDLWPVLAGLAIGGLGAMFLPALLPAGAAALGMGGAAAGAGAAGAGGLAGLGAIGATEAGLAAGLGGAGALIPATATGASIGGLGGAATALGGAGAGALATAPAWGLGGIAGGVGNWMMNNPLPTMVLGSGVYDAATAKSTKTKKDKSIPKPEQVMLRERYQSGPDSYNNFGQPYYVNASDYYGYADGGMINQPQGMGSLQSMGSEDTIRQFDRQIVKGAMNAMQGQSSDPEGDIGRFIERFGRQALADLSNRVGGEGQSPGRMIEGPGTGRSDSIPGVVRETNQPIKVSNGEFIMPKHAVDRIGPDKLYQMAQP